MKTELKPSLQVNFADVKEGDTFLWDDHVHMKMRHGIAEITSVKREANCVRFYDGLPRHFTPGMVVTPCPGKFVQE